MLGFVALDIGEVSPTWKCCAGYTPTQIAGARKTSYIAMPAVEQNVAGHQLMSGARCTLCGLSPQAVGQTREGFEGTVLLQRAAWPETDEAIRAGAHRFPCACRKRMQQKVPLEQRMWLMFVRPACT